MNERKRISTGYIAANIGSFHREGVLAEMKRLYLEEIKEFFDIGADGKKKLREDYVCEVPCPVCGTPRGNGLVAIRINGFEHIRCVVCSNVYVTPRLKEKYIWAQYSRPSYIHMFRNLIENSLDFRKDVIAAGKFKWVVKRLKNPKAHTLLDIGSGLGENLAVYKEHGWEVLGIELNEYAAQKSRELFGVTVLNTPIETAKLPREQFDVISLWGVLEHLVDPCAILRQAFRYLAPDGILVAMVPNFNCLLASYLQDFPEEADRLLDGDKHLVVYTREGIEYLAKKLDLQVVDIASRGLDLSSILSYTNDENTTKLHRLLTKEKANLQMGIESMGFGDHLWVVFSKS